MMKERPMLMSAPMVRAILAGSKTQTRRIVKSQPHGVGQWVMRGINWLFPNVNPFLSIKCPYGQPGDRLWVRETWQGPLLGEDQEEEFHRDGPERFMKPEFCVYRATDLLDAIDCDGNELGWRPSIHMPRWASRITLEITGVRVERLNEISAADALAEGINRYPFRPDDGWPVCEGYTHLPDDGKCVLHPSAASAFQALWESINGASSWDANPWVWVIEFNRVAEGARP